MRGCLQQSRRQLVTGWLLAIFATLVYALTMDCSVSWWDCGEFITTSYGLQVGHPPGAPVYQLLAHCFTLLSFGNPMLVAPLSNLLSVVCAALTVMLLYWTIEMLLDRADTGNMQWGAVVGALCYLFCDTVWFSAVESEVYAPAMLCCALMVYIMLRWERRGGGWRLLLTALLLGLGAGVHMMTLLTLPALALILIRRTKIVIKEGGSCKRSRVVGTIVKVGMAGLFFFMLGLTPYLIIPLRAQANPPINQGDPSTKERFVQYVSRDQYAKAPLWPRMWRDRPTDKENYQEWAGNDHGFWPNVVYYGKYQLGYMYGRYLMYNFIGRENGRWHCVVLYILPFLLGLNGLLWQCRRNRRHDLWPVLLLFLFGGVILNFYLNHPCYEPRERDYVYVLSFYAFAIWIGVGAEALRENAGKADSKAARITVTALLVLSPLTLAAGNWSDHDRHNCHSVHDIAMNHLQSCDEGAILFTVGDNDTFPLWYLQQVEGCRTDIDIYNINLTGIKDCMDIIGRNAYRRPVYLSHYAYQSLGRYAIGRLRCEGFCWRLLPIEEGESDLEPLKRHVTDSAEWHITECEYLPWVSESFINIWKENTAAVR